MCVCLCFCVLCKCGLDGEGVNEKFGVQEQLTALTLSSSPSAKLYQLNQHSQGLMRRMDEGFCNGKINSL